MVSSPVPQCRCGTGQVRLVAHDREFYTVVKPMPFTQAVIDHLCELARLELTSQEKEKFRQQLSQILEYVEQIAEVDTSSTRSMFSVPDLKNVSRDDRVEPFGEERKLVEQAPTHEDQLITVKAVKLHDPTVEESSKDGVSWSETPHRPDEVGTGARVKEE